ncbi:uncharacterized protein LOC107019368 [Solanum pennellii]|uniref:Uncharacterized protein LOC107019368 n=1 Tax=Solanum pennellii TaxID=28526 RepID=A0ABM1GSQ5_SOLPN|nr:uncharacterized protein LOC107019368 [Solanum pennellii]
MVKDMRSRMSFFVAGLGHLSSKEGRATMLIGDMDISWFMIYVQQKQKALAPSSTSEPATKNNCEHYRQSSSVKPSYSQGSVVQVGSKPPAYTKCGRNHSGVCHDSFAGFSSVGNDSRVNRAQYSSIAPPDKDAPRGATSGAGRGTNHLYALNNRQDHENFPDVITGMIQVLDFTVYAF